MRLCIFEDRPELLEPLTLTRPTCDLRCGLTTLAEKQRIAVGASELGVLVRAPLEAVYRQQHPGIAVNDPDWLRGDDVLMINSRWLPPAEGFTAPTRSCVAMVGDAVAFVMMKKEDATAIQFEELPDRLRKCLDTTPPLVAGGRMITYPWDLVDQNADEIRRDFRWLGPTAHGSQACGQKHSPAVLGPIGQLWVASSAMIEPMVIVDTRHGPVVIDEDAVVAAFTRLEGPCYIGRGTQVLGAKIRAGTTIGPQSRVGGEVEASIIHGCTNKYHEGFLGHSYLGEWVNIGAGTHNSDLRNDYGEVVMTMHGAAIATGMTKIGCFLGDHTKTGLGTLLNTGTRVGAFCNVLPAGGFAPKQMPSFTTWWNGSLREAFTLDQLLTTAEVMMKRRGMMLTEEYKTLYTWLFEETANERRRVMRESDQRRLRKSA